ncbi:MAG: insecticidal toxin complex protein [candidate division KSB1 bacterium]|nr:insecticidal toxin complex protein [candidate division KSB1 bacterium]MDZ7368827.1 insecticidal toxin complex protein [candidate division KSB1 bacterium]MDZ7406671.1 insecticidal toxin complex protein [candidate division KSB1 bacterium]
MPSLLVIRLHPVEPISGDDFTSYLNGLSIAAHEVSFNDPTGSGPAFSTAPYIAPTLPPSPSPNPIPIHDPNNRITQHFRIDPVPLTGDFARTFFAVATAVIEIPTPPAGGEYRTADVRLVITRGGGEIVHKQIYYNVPVAPAPMPADPNNFPGLQPTSLHLALPSPGQQLSETVIVPEDGTAPNFEKLRTAVENVLNAEPGHTTGIADLAYDKCRHIAYEIIWDRMAYPLPKPKRPLETIYTGPHGATSDEELDRKIFESDLLTYYVKHNSEAERLANFVFSLSAAIWCEQKSRQTTEAGFNFPVFPDSPGRQAKVILKGVGAAALVPAFEVPAAYFYALMANLPPQVKREQRFKMATLNAEAQIVANIEQALDDNVLVEPAGVNRFQAARRLRALGSVGEVGTPKCEVTPASAVHGLVSNWLAFTGADINAFWVALSAADVAGHLDLLLCAITKAHAPLVAAIKAPAFGVNNVNDLAAKTNQDWEALLHPNPALLPEFTKPGTSEERTQAFIRHLRKFFDVANVFDSPDAPIVNSAPGLTRSAGNPLDELLILYPGFTFNSWDPTLLQNALNLIFPGDTAAQVQFTAWLTCIQRLINLTNGITPVEMQFSVMEALWARGFTNAQSIQGFSSEDFKEALAGSVAYDHAQTIWTNAGAVEPSPAPGPAGFKPVNPDGSLVNCVPPAHLSPLGPVAYLHDLLKASAKSTCENPLRDDVERTLNTLLTSRRGPLGDLLATKANLEVPIPLIDLVNESLEYMVAKGAAHGTIYNTARDQVGGHELASNPNPGAAGATFQHDPVTLFEALPEHSTPAVPTDEQTAYDKLKNDFSSCVLPYSQPLDVSRTYLQQLGTSRFATMRRFRKDITEFVLDPANETAEFQKHLWRYPVRLETAIEYLGITPEEYATLFQNNILIAALRRGRRSRAARALANGEVPLYQLYGFPAELDENEQSWTKTITQLSEFLERTCLTYCELIELWKSEFVRFGLKGHPEEGFPDCEPCCLEKYLIEFIEPADPVEALKRLIIFIRLWRKLQAVPNARYTFTELRDICEVLELFDGANVNPDFIRQLAAFQMFRDDFRLSLTDGTPPAPGATGADRLHLLAFWVPGAAKLNWAVEHLLNQIQQYAMNVHGCGCREPEFIKLLMANMDPLSALAGFDPNNPADTWHAHPTHTLRFAEILAKIYASEFRVGELLFLFTNDEHLQGDDPFPLQTKNEAKDSPLGLPDDEDKNSLWALRKKLMAVEMSAEAAAPWTWARMETALREEFGFVPPPAPNNRWLSIGQHFFPAALADSGIAVSPLEKQYRVPLPPPTSELMWNTPPDGPFRYDLAAQELWTQVPLTDEAVLAKLSRIRQLTPVEQSAVCNLYFKPRLDLAHFAFIFNNFGEAEERLIQEPDEAKRWAWFQQQFARFYQCCHIIAEHLAAHTADATSSANPEGTELAKLLLKNLWADENMALTPWENDNGQSPNVTWQPQPNGGAFAALLGLTGTGMLAEYFGANQMLRWREVRGGIDAFGAEENAWNAPIPTILPTMNSASFTLSPEQLRYAALRNGFAMANADGAMLGGAEPFTLRWQGLLLIENEGQYGFSAGAPTPAGKVPDFEKADQSHRWRVILKRGQKIWVLLAHDWPNEEAPADCSKPIALKKGFYELSIELERKPLAFDGPEDVCPQTTGFQLKYNGPDAGMEWLAVPHDKLFQEQKNAALHSGLQLPNAAQDFLAAHFTSTVRDMRRTYQRAFKAMLLVNRLHLSAKRIADDGQSELGYLLAQPVNFSGQAYYRSGAAFVTHKANFDFNFLPVLDNYYAPPVVQDQRVAPSAQRRQAMFDWWERLFDYTVMRRETQCSPEQPAWLLFHEAAETHEDNPAHLLRHIGVDLRHDKLVLQFFDAGQTDLSYDVTSADLEDDRWAVRVWHSEKWVRALLRCFYPKDITVAEVFLWASDGPEITGNANLTQFYRDGCIENGEPRRYEEIKRLNDALRQRGRQALVAYLTHMNRVPLPWSGFATEAKHLSELLLLDVEAGLCQKASRIEEAVSAAHLFVQRARLGLESGFVILPGFVLAWERHFATFRTWEACKRRFIYRENWIEWDELQDAKQTEAFQFLESELRRATLTMPVPGGLTYWNGSRPPVHPGITLLQYREPAIMQFLNPAPEGLGLMGTPDRHARPTWLAPMNIASRGQTPGDNPSEPPADQPNDVPVLLAVANPQQINVADLPMWLQATVRLGTKFIRVAAAGIPPATTTFAPKCNPSESSACCSVCGKAHPALMDEYYFWIEDTRYYDEQEQVAEWGAIAEDPNGGILGDPQTDWHRPDKLPGLLQWNSKPMVHLRWCRVHNGEFQQPRQSYEGVRIAPGTTPQLVFAGRRGDSLRFEITGGEAPIGYAPEPPPGFRYDLATDEAITLPQVAVATAPPLVGGMAAYPYFAWFNPGAPLLPPSLFSPAIAVAGHLRAHCRFEEAVKWYEFVYNPLLNDNTWMICPSTGGEEDEAPTDPEGIPTEPVVTQRAEECCCASDPVSEAEVKERAILLHYLDTLLQWGDALMRKNTPEAFQQARLIFDTAAKILGAMPITVLAKDDAPAASKVAEFEPECAPINPRLMCLYTSVNDRLALIHACLNAKRLKNGRPNLDMPYFGNSEIRDCWKITKDVCADESDWCLPQSPYRFMVLVQKAQEITGEVRALGAALLAAYEKGDAEYLSTMRAMHERQLLNLALEVRQNQWREADWQVQALQKTKQIAQTRLQYYQNLIAAGLIAGEAQYEPLTISSTTLRAAGNIAEAIGQAMNLIPDPYVGFPVSLVKLPPGTKMSMIFSAAGKIAITVADILNTIASLGLTKAGWERREQEWQHQVNVLTVEIEQIERQILAAERRRDIALRELNNHQQQIENAAEVHDFLRDKFTNHALYLWMQQETAAIYYQMYEMALHCARQAQRAFNFERGHTARQFIPAEIWDNLHEGLLAGERLQLAVRHMEKAYYDENLREYELTKHISLRLHFPMALLQLQVNGCCEIEIPEWMFDLDYPGHYMRRLKNVTMTIPCVVGPYTGVHCRLTLLSSKTRVDPRLVKPPHTCCHDERWQNGYQALPDDPRVVSTYAATEAIATSGGQNDSGMFELNFRDERYLPFEFAGAVSRWRIELPQENNQFDVETISDVVLHLNYTAREGGEALRRAANEVAQQNLPGAGVRFFDVQRELPEAWQLFQNCSAEKSAAREFGLRLGRNMFPFLPGHREVKINRLAILFEAPGAEPSAHHLVEFLAGHMIGHAKDERCECEVQSINCVASAEWPCLYHGVLDIRLGPLPQSGHHDLGTFRFPSGIGEISRAFLFCGYEATTPRECSLIGEHHKVNLVAKMK